MSIPKGLTRALLETWTAVYVDGKDVTEVAVEQGVDVQAIRLRLRRALYLSATGSMAEQRGVEAAQIRRLRARLQERLDDAEDIAEVLPVVDRWAKLGEQYAKLLGLNAPMQVEVTDLSRLTDEQLRARWKEITGSEYQGNTAPGGAAGQGAHLPDVGRVVPGLPMGPEVREPGVFQAGEHAGGPAAAVAVADGGASAGRPYGGRGVGGA